ncbi:MAG: LysR substrate-binding domain-containing protein [Hyphomonadaceae bacterium]|nr:LysR substrate-binding domain-containing protein [Hyphomonadaceae bacterium]
MKLSQLQAVLAVAECGSLRAAGRHLKIAQPAITRSIREIERELGVSLFERTAKGVRVTPIGAAFLRRAEAIRAELQRATDEIEQLKGRTSGQVSLGLSGPASIVLLPRAVQAFRKRFPDAVIKVIEAMFQSVEQDLLDGRIDFYVGPIDPNVSRIRLMVEELYVNQRRVMARKGHPLLNARRLSELKDAKWLRPTHIARNTEADFSAMLADLGLPNANIVVHGSATLTTLPLIAASDLLTVLPETMLEFAPFAEILEPLKLEEQIPGVTTSIVRRHDMPLTPMAEHLCDQVRRIGQSFAEAKPGRMPRKREAAQRGVFAGAAGGEDGARPLPAVRDA